MDDGDGEDVVGVGSEERQSRLAANRPPSSSAIVAAAANEDDGNTFDCDSEELEALEDAAEEEDVDEDELNGEVDRAAELYPSGVVEDLLEELKQDGMMHFMQRHVFGKTEGQVKALFIAFGVLLPRELRTQSMTPALLVSILKTILTRHLRQRKKLEQYNAMDDAVDLVKRSRNIIVLSGSGISTSVGIPDFRSKDGIYAQLQREGKYNLIDPQEMFDIDYFLHDPSCFFSFAKRIFPSNFMPSPCHRFIKLLETKGKLTRNYTQNIDTLEQVAGIENVLYCHGSFSQAKCTTPGCGYEVAGSAIKEDIFAQRIPYCPKCEDAFQEKKKQQEAMKKRQSMKKGNKKAKGGRSYGGDSDEDDDDDDGQADTLRGLGVVKPCITFFGEKLSDEFDRNLLADRSKVDLLIVIGTSLQVAPVSELVGHIPHRTPVILINKTPVLHMGMDIQLLGDADTIIQYLCNRLEWDLPLLPEPNKEVVGTESKAEEVANEILDKGPEGEEVAVAMLKEGKMEKEELREEEAAAAAAAKSGGVQEPKRLGDTHFWLFPGAEAETLIKMLEEKEKEGEKESDDGSDGKDSDASSPSQQEGQEIEESNRGVKRSASGDLEHHHKTRSN